MAVENTSKDKDTSKFTKVDNEILKIAIIAKYNEIYRKDDTPIKSMRWNDLVKLKSDVKELSASITKILIDDMVNPTSFKVEKMGLEVGELLNKHFDTKNIDLGIEGKKEQLAKKVIVEVNAIYRDSIKDSSTSKQVKIVDVMDLFNAKGLDMPNLKNLDMTIKFSKAKISDLSEKAIDTISKKLEDKRVA